MSTPAIVASNVTVRYRPYADRIPTARRSLARLRHREQREVIALDSVSVVIPRGEAVGVIGRNGAGKSTLLRVLAGTLEPNSGRVELHTAPPALLQLGVGFNPKLSGRDNVLLGGMALGHSRARMNRELDEIGRFADLGDAIDRPVNTYSTGMRSRLAFAVAMTLHPETLLLDELLAVGDADFKAKSMAAMEGMLERAGTVVMVTHSLPRLEQFCDTAIWLESGKVRMTGAAGDVVEAYRANEEDRPEEHELVEADAAAAIVEPAPAPALWGAKQRTQLIRRLMLGETAAELSNETGVSEGEIRAWRRRFVSGGRKALRPRLDPDDD